MKVMQKTKPSASLVVTLAVAFFVVTLLLPAVPATAGSPRLERQEEARVSEPEAEPGDAPGRGWGEQLVDAVLDILVDWIHGPVDHPGRPDNGDQGASLDPSGYRLSKH